MSRLCHRITTPSRRAQLQDPDHQEDGLRLPEPRAFKTAIYFHCGGLDLYPATHGKPDEPIFNTTGILDDVNGAYSGIAPGPSGDGVLAYVEFTTISTEAPNVRIEEASVTSAVPEPATLGLLASGLALLGIRRVRGRQQIT